MSPSRSKFAMRTCNGITQFAELIKIRERIFDQPPQVGIVVGTFAAVPYIHLQLEARRRFYPATPMLIHDDASPKGQEIEVLCERYRADFETNTERMVPCKGDLTAFIGGFYWADQLGVELLVKLSRRFLPLRNWISELAALAFNSQYATYCSWTTTFGFGFRSECVAMAVKEWFDQGLVEAIVRELEVARIPFVEAFIHDLCRRAAFRNCEAARAYDDRVGARPPDRNGYAVWDFMGYDRATRADGFLWHDSAGPDEYARLAARWGLPYDPSDFLDPNQGGGECPRCPVNGEAPLIS